VIGVLGEVANIEFVSIWLLRPN